MYAKKNKTKPIGALVRENESFIKLFGYTKLCVSQLQHRDRLHHNTS